MLYKITHTTEFDYSHPVSISYHLRHLEPRSLQNQQQLSFSLKIDPVPTILTKHIDYFGNPAVFVTLEGLHRKLVITGYSEVSTLSNCMPDPWETPAWERVRDLCRGAQIGVALDASEFIFDSKLIKINSAFEAYAIKSFPRHKPILEAVLDLTARIHRDFTFDPKATTLTTPLEEVFRTRRGVCQDFAQFEIACLRCLGLPARYVSGYLETQPPPGSPRLQGADASHAWISFFAPGIGWIDVDPTNNILPDDRHITVSWGRDFSDVSPVRGVILGNGAHELLVAVDVLPLEPEIDRNS